MIGFKSAIAVAFVGFGMFAAMPVKADIFTLVDGGGG